jgi:poly(A) polymerase
MKKGVDYEKIVETLKNIIKGTQYENHVFTVGGCERDLLLNNPIKDVDIVVDMENGGIKFAQWLYDNAHIDGTIVVYEHFGTAMFRLKECPYETIEAVQTRKECYRDMESRNPETAFGTLEDDCQRRDFTVNAIYRNISTGEVLDLNGKSFSDIGEKIIRTCGDPDIIFSEDPLRILRAIRFRTRLGFTIENKTFEGMKKHLHRLEIISRERITDEFCKMVQSNKAYDAVRLISNIEALKYVIPCDYTEEELNNKIFTDDVLNSFSYVSSNLAVRLSRIFLNFSNEETEIILRDMRISNDVINQVLWCKNHNDYRVVNTLKGLRKLLYDCKNVSRFINILAVYQYYGVDSMKVYKEALREVGSKMFGYKLPVNGNDVMKTLNIEGGPKIKIILDELLDYAFYDPDITKEFCIDYIKKHFSE